MVSQHVHTLSPPTYICGPVIGGSTCRWVRQFSGLCIPHKLAEGFGNVWEICFSFVVGSFTLAQCWVRKRSHSHLLLVSYSAPLVMKSMAATMLVMVLLVSHGAPCLRIVLAMSKGQRSSMIFIFNFIYFILFQHISTI